MPHRDRESRDRRSGRAVLNVPLNRTADWIGPVEHDHGEPPPSGGFHDRRDGGWVGVIARSGVLEVDHENVYLRKHRGRGRMEPYTIVQQVDGRARSGVRLLPALGRDVDVNAAPEPVLWCEKG